MIVVDTSAIVAVLFEEPEARSFRRILEASDNTIAPASVYLETCMATLRRGIDRPKIDGFFAIHAVTLVPVDEALARAAAGAFERFGKGVHAARLNFGDCFAYATAIAHDAPLLFKGGAFAATDVRAVV